ncbi:hypothetical protein [Flavobacterium silvaticum]|uniref:Uncharacterized protein n=1 Tax=Flavobacterium silvaticum TaxID=1852020 RepID=A0A972FNF9_9FLAO|nr:hypothetical protein [Flavobacterium silvaticum]NMH26449.1 hypothetical protein [Flavobacterium silvaticum]
MKYILIKDKSGYEHLININKIERVQGWNDGSIIYLKNFEIDTKENLIQIKNKIDDCQIE